jgi:protein-tyrosine phosphatase
MHAGKIPELMSGPAERPVRVLFICHYNRKRSATAERVFAKDPSLDVRSAGTSDEAMVQVNERMLDWADIVFVMEDDQREWLARTFPGHRRLAETITLDIKDEYPFVDPELVTLLTERVTPYLTAYHSLKLGSPQT